MKNSFFWLSAKKTWEKNVFDKKMVKKMPKPFDERIGTVSSQRDHENDLKFANNLNRFVILLALIVTIVLFFL